MEIGDVVYSSLDVQTVNCSCLKKIAFKFLMCDNVKCVRPLVSTGAVGSTSPPDFKNTYLDPLDFHFRKTDFVTFIFHENIYFLPYFGQI